MGTVFSENVVQYFAPDRAVGFLVILNSCTVPLYCPISSPVSDECRISDQQLMCYVEIHTDDPQ